MLIKLGDFRDSQVQELLRRHLNGMLENSPAEHVFALDWSGLQQPEITFYTAWEESTLCGCGALKELGNRAGEIKSMRTADAFLRQGVARGIVVHIIKESMRRGYHRLSLETGSGPAFEPALALYRSLGFTIGDKFADYQQTEFCRFMHLELAGLRNVEDRLQASAAPPAVSPE
jgi:putative acetyltransferase